MKAPTSAPQKHTIQHKNKKLVSIRFKLGRSPIYFGDLFFAFLLFIIKLRETIIIVTMTAAATP
jgi:hypothetical protein